MEFNFSLFLYREGTYFTKQKKVIFFERQL